MKRIRGYVMPVRVWPWSAAVAAADNTVGPLSDLLPELLLTIGEHLFSVTDDSYLIVQTLQSALQVNHHWHTTFDMHALNNSGMIVAFWKHALLKFWGRPTDSATPDELCLDWRAIVNSYGITLDSVSAGVTRSFPAPPHPSWYTDTDARSLPPAAPYFLLGRYFPFQEDAAYHSTVGGTGQQDYRFSCTHAQSCCLIALMELYMYIRWKPLSPALNGENAQFSIRPFHLDMNHIFFPTSEGSRFNFQLRISYPKQFLYQELETARLQDTCTLCISTKTITLQCCDQPQECGCKMQFISLDAVISFLHVAQHHAKNLLIFNHFRKHTSKRQRLHH
jgi:hypothetical protein